MFNVLCCWVGPKNESEYPIEYVHKLYRGVERNLDIEFQFWVLTDKPELFDNDKIKTLAYKEESKGWWAKPYLFGHSFDGPVLYLDIDVVILNNITKLVNTCMKQDKFVLFKDPKTGWGNSSIMFWNGFDKYKHIYEIFIEDPKLWSRRFQRNYIGNYADQAYIVYQVLEITDIHKLGFDQWWCDSTTVYDPGRDAEFLVLAGPEQKPHNVKRTLVTELVEKHWI